MAVQELQTGGAGLRFEDVAHALLDLTALPGPDVEAAPCSGPAARWGRIAP
ncbi:hypothetical protein ACWDRR_31075 [Kitasatospora sp. NPDC003701]